MRANHRSVFILGLVAFASLLLLLLAFAAIAYSNRPAAVAFVLATPVLAAVVAFRTSEAPAAIAAAILLPAVSFALWSSSVSESSSPPPGPWWPAVLLGSFFVVWLAGRFGRSRKGRTPHEHIKS
jgi:hypothetical protein